jgi:hypothetical protein
MSRGRELIHLNGRNKSEVDPAILINSSADVELSKPETEES